MRNITLPQWEQWLVEEQWQGYRLDEIICDTSKPARSDEWVDLLNQVQALRSLFVLTAGFAGETGEALEHFKKWIRDGVLDKPKAALELGDALAYLTWLTHTLGFSLADLAEMNHAKLTARAKKEMP